jgi:hypothetical protein
MNLRNTTERPEPIKNLSGFATSTAFGWRDKADVMLIVNTLKTQYNYLERSMAGQFKPEVSRFKKAIDTTVHALR